MISPPNEGTSAAPFITTAVTETVIDLPDAASPTTLKLDRDTLIIYNKMTISLTKDCKI